MATKQREIEESKIEMKKDMIAYLNENEAEKKAKEKRIVAELIDSVDDLDEDKKKLLNKSLYELASEMQNDNMAPSVDSYGNQGVFMRYKKNQWFENVNIIELKRLKAKQEGEVLLELLDVGKKIERDKAREKRKREMLK
mmetsp:Transcript_3825/g.5116  ORF Transcript_3825/g.5116 Transcript_3825/m.5116 type:complete len:140 (+) Transcript_3825:303-722(+)